MLRNGSFTEGWTDMPPAPGHLINQQPAGWTLRWLEPGESLFGAGDKAQGIPECVHKLANQLPPNEQHGAANALILEGGATYKIFHSGAPFGAELSQTVTGLQPGTTAKLIVPVLVVLHGETDPYGAESGVWVNGEGHWVHGFDMGDRSWYRHEREVQVPADGTLKIEIRVKSKWPRPKDFFIDGVTLDAQAQTTAATSRETPQPAPGGGAAGGSEQSSVIRIKAPQGARLDTVAGDEPGRIILTVPPGMSVQME